MAGQGGIIDDPEIRARWGGFQWTDENARRAKEIVARYPEGRQMSASIPLLDLAQVTAQELAELKPADNIDIQSFIWTVCTYDEDAEQGLDREVREAREPRETREVREPREVDA